MLVIILCMAVVFHDMFLYQLFESTVSLVRPRRNIFKQNLCVDVMQEMRNGKWRPRPDLQPEEELHRREQDIRIRNLRGLPIKLHRQDMRCGNKFAIEAPAFGPSIPALCDPNSTAPCCNHEIAWCGSGEKNCSCDRCRDFRNTVTAELSEFVPSSGCEFNNFTSEEACKLLSERVTSLTLIGDSLVRHLNVALLILFSNDKETGSLIKDIHESHIGLCSGDMQFVDGGKTTCHGKTAGNIDQLSKGKFCQGKHNFQYSFHAFYSLAQAKFALDEVREHLHKNNSVVAIGVGLHIGLNAKEVLNGYLKPILRLKEQANSTWPLIVWLTVHAQGSLKPIQFLQHQNNEIIYRFNRELRAFLEPIGVPIFDTFNLTLGVHSYDGTHYGFGVNMIKAQLFLNFLNQTFS